MKLVIFALLAAIIISLGFGLFFLTNEKNDRKKLLRSLQIRIALSIVLIVVLISAYVFGWVGPLPS